ncbi:MAG: hypothetical protein U9N73_09045, partial [Candidatus Auribacterota bacterium]|nr:hypothetical protein [Candidatus Auribacterota bacterium]
HLWISQRKHSFRGVTLEIEIPEKKWRNDDLLRGESTSWAEKSFRRSIDFSFGLSGNGPGNGMTWGRTWL